MNRSTALQFTAGALAAAAIGTPRSARAQNGKLRVAALPIDIAGAAYYAQDQGFFAKNGLDVELVTLANGAAVAAAVAGGALDIGNGNSIAISSAYEHGIAFRMLAPSGAYTKDDPSDGLIVQAGSPIRTAADLAGKTIGINGLRNISEIYTRSWIDKNGGNSGTAQFTELSFAEMGAAVQSGRVACAAVEEPQLTSALATGGIRQICSPGEAIAPIWIEGGYFCTEDFVKTHLDVVRRVAQAIRDANDWANKNRAASAAILGKYSKTQIVPKHRCYYPPRLDAAQLQPLIDGAVRYGVLKGFRAQDIFVPGLT